MTLIPLWAKALVLAVIIGIIFGAGFKTGYHIAHNHEIVALADIKTKQADAIVQLVNENKKKQAALDDKSAKLQDALSNTHTVTKYVTHTVAVEVAKPVYKECVLPASGVAGLRDFANQYNAIRSIPNNVRKSP